jgi:hypothetical protein
LKHQPKRRFCHTLFQFSEELISKTGGRALLYLISMPDDRLIGSAFDGEPGSSSMTDDPDHPDRVLPEFLIRISDGSDDPPAKVFHPADIVKDGKICNIVEKAIDRDIPPEGIFFRCPKALCPDHLPIFDLFLFEFRVTSKGGDFDNLSFFEKDLNEPESPADDPAVPEKGIDLMGVSIGCHIEVFWCLA